MGIGFILGQSGSWVIKASSGDLKVHPARHSMTHTLASKTDVCDKTCGHTELKITRTKTKVYVVDLDR